MDLSGYTPYELARIQDILLVRKQKFHMAKSKVKVESRIDHKNIHRKIRYGRLITACNQRIGLLNNVLHKTESGTKVSKRRRKAERALALNQWMRDKIAELRDPNSDLPLVIIGNFALRELPFELSKYEGHKRLRVFLLKGTQCVVPGCSCKATRLIESMDLDGGFHLDVFTDELWHMNVDHIKPKSLGGSNDLDNLQPMCAYHNQLKGSTHVE